MLGGGEGNDYFVEVVAGDEALHVFEGAEALGAAVAVAGADGDAPVGAAGDVGDVGDVACELVAKLGALKDVFHDALARDAVAYDEGAADVDAATPEEHAKLAVEETLDGEDEEGGEPEVDEDEAAGEDGVEEQRAQGEGGDAYEGRARDDAEVVEPGRASGERVEAAHLEGDEGEGEVGEDVGVERGEREVRFGGDDVAAKFEAVAEPVGEDEGDDEKRAVNGNAAQDEGEAGAPGAS